MKAWCMLIFSMIAKASMATIKKRGATLSSLILALTLTAMVCSCGLKISTTEPALLHFFLFFELCASFSKVIGFLFA